MSPIKSLAFKRYALLISTISLNSIIISPYSQYIKKGLVYIAIVALSRRQPSFYLKYTKVNTQLSYNIYLVSLNKYTL